MTSRDLLWTGRVPSVRKLLLCLAVVLMVRGTHAAALPGLQAMADDDLSEVSGSDGLAFNLVGFQMNGPLTLTYTSPDAGHPSFWLSNFWLSRSDDLSATFSDPYRLNIYSRDGMADVIELSNPLNANGLVKWQFAADFGSQANGVTFDGGALIVRDLAFYGGGLSISTPADPNVEGVAFGLAMRVDIGNLIIRPQGREDITVEDSSSVRSQMNIAGVHIRSATDPSKPWVISDVTYQPGIFNAITENGQSYLHLGIDWSSSPDGAPRGQLVIDNVSFKSTDGNGAVTTTNLGAARINTIQIQYLDVKFR